MRSLNRSSWLGPLALALAFVLSACAVSAATSSDSPAESLSESPAPAPTATPVPAPTPTPIPTTPAEAPTESPAPAPTATPVPAPTPTPIPTAPAADVASKLPADFQISLYQGEDVLGGQVIQFSDVFARGKPVVLSVWAGRCPICHIEMPDLEEAYTEYKDRVIIVGIDVGPFVGLGSQEDGRALLQALQITYPAGATPDSEILREYRVLGTPATYYFTPSGRVVDRWNGLLSGAQMREKIEALLKASGAG